MGVLCLGVDRAVLLGYAMETCCLAAFALSNSIQQVFPTAALSTHWAPPLLCRGQPGSINTVLNIPASYS